MLRGSGYLLEKICTFSLNMALWAKQDNNLHKFVSRKIFGYFRALQIDWN